MKFGAGRVWPRPARTSAAMNSGEVVEGPVWSRPMQTPAPFKPGEAGEGPVWQHPMQSAASMKSGRAVESLAARHHVWPHRMRTPASMLSAGSRDGRPEEHRLPGSGRRGQPEIVVDEQEYWRRRQAEGEAQAAPAIDGIFPAFRRNTLNLSRACLTFAVLVVVVITCYIIVTRLIFLSKWSPMSLLNSFYGPSLTSATHGTRQPAMWR
ncbi:uncharacterized protein [Dermacentor andersoni]|uniref:uncharacterized protein n=1 Tax=Dermacentor andersoni TaxID=34620 RepID=UPI002416E816|nr:uncharacterized protein LOC129380764 [Dermacentor andersoni]